MKRFDEKFAQQVKDAFGSYNADHLADAGWNAFQKKQGKSRRIGIIIPFWAKAASVTVLLTVGSFATYKLSEKPVVHQITETKESIPQEVKPDTVTEKITLPIQQKETKEERNVQLKPQKIVQPEPAKTIPEQVIAENNEVAAVIDSSKSSPFMQITEKVIAEVTEESVATSNEQLKDTIVDEAAVTKPLVVQTLIEPDENSSKDKRISLSAGISGMIARVEDMISSAPGVSVGLYAERQLTDRISVRPGLALAKHTFGLQSLADNTDALTAPTIDGYSGEVISYDNHMDIIAMEIPINFVFDIFQKKGKNIFVSAGASTMVYLNQHFSSTYNNLYTQDVYNNLSGEWEVSYTNTTVSNDNQYDAFSHTDFFGLANLSAGYVFPIGKKSSMLIEPFVQIPISNLTSSNLRMGFGGISVKYLLNSQN